MRELPDMMDFVNGAYAVAIVAIVVLVIWSWRDMVRAERKREETRRK